MAGKTDAGLRKEKFLSVWGRGLTQQGARPRLPVALAKQWEEGGKGGGERQRPGRGDCLGRTALLLQFTGSPLSLGGKPLVPR